MIMTTEEAREILGSDAQGMSDEAIQELVSQLSSLARAYVQSILRGEVDVEALVKTT